MNPLVQWFPNFFVRGTLQGYFKWNKEPPPELPSKHKRFFSPRLPLLSFRTLNKIMHNKSNHKAR